MLFHEILVGRYNNSIGAVVAMKSIVNSLQILSHLN